MWNYLMENMWNYLNVDLCLTYIYINLYSLVLAVASALSNYCLPMEETSRTSQERSMMSPVLSSLGKEKVR